MVRKYTVALLTDQIIALRTPGILGSSVDGDHHVLCILTSAKTLNTKDTREHFRWAS